MFLLINIKIVLIILNIIDCHDLFRANITKNFTYYNTWTVVFGILEFFGNRLYLNLKGNNNQLYSWEKNQSVVSKL